MAARNSPFRETTLPQKRKLPAAPALTITDSVTPLFGAPYKIVEWRCTQGRTHRLVVPESLAEDAVKARVAAHTPGAFYLVEEDAVPDAAIDAKRARVPHVNNNYMGGIAPTRLVAGIR
ncbi:DUF2866 domain-containing protein [Paraburkholderia sp. UCT31]|uniref:DUF2866 domain-containing protein n=1 Tax=Paraburkholderia sp. UCT31 TaxID=2615209 RepID=UPI00165549D5|nr:DUF2866 domain-containing protein [Paraburkholderia sp. UCT31]MBC8737078.1 DUF2866 domain-containing protein [Paraburkholderia sp. UCT31]